MCIGLVVKCPLYLLDFNETWILALSREMCEKFSKIKVHENPFSKSPVVPCGRTQGHTYMQLTVAFRIFANAPKTGFVIYDRSKSVCSNYKNEVCVAGKQAK